MEPESPDDTTLEREETGNSPDSTELDTEEPSVSISAAKTDPDMWKRSEPQVPGGKCQQVLTELQR